MGFFAVCALAAGADAAPYRGPGAAPASPWVQLAQAETPAAGVFHGVGILTEISPQNGSLTINHGDIVGFMSAMEMTYNVKTRDLDAGLHVGDKVAFDIDGASYMILAVKLLERAK
jgi:Cu/Ag efflux protein CusF